MATSKQIKLWIAAKKKSVVKLQKELNAAKARIKKLEGDMKKAVAAEKKAAAKKKAATKKKAAPKKKKAAKKKAAPKKKKAAPKKKAKK